LLFTALKVKEINSESSYPGRAVVMPLRSVGEVTTATPAANLARQGLSLPPSPSPWDALVLGDSPGLKPHTPWSQRRTWKSMGHNPGPPKPQANVPPSARNSKRQWRNLLICC